jgi:hypothetical protein
VVAFPDHSLEWLKCAGLAPFFVAISGKSEKHCMRMFFSSGMLEKSGITDVKKSIENNRILKQKYFVHL